MPFTRLFLLSASLFSLGLFTFGQTQPEAPLVRTTTRLVQVSVIAKAKDGSPAVGLKQENFHILADGRPQQISFFAMDSVHSLPNPPQLPHGSFSNTLAARGQVPTSITVVLLDLINTKMTDRMYARLQMIKYLLSIQPEERVAVYLFNGRLSVLHDYTSDMSEFQSKLAEAKDRLVNISKTETAGAVGEQSEEFAEFVNPAGGGSAAQRAFFLRNRVLGTLNVLKFIAQHMAEAPGRKNLIWLSGGFPIQMGYETMSNFSEDFTQEWDAAVRALSDGNVAVYPIDARGLVANTGMSASMPSAASNSISRNPRPPSMPKNGGGNYLAKVHMNMEEIANRTGGHAFYNTNDLARAIHDAVQDSSVTYVLGFYPENEKNNREFHNIKVTVDQPHVNLHYRSGYLDLPDVPATDKARTDQMRDAVWSPLDATELGFQVKVSQSVGSAASLLGTAPTPAVPPLDLTITVEPRGIGLKPENDRFTGRIDVLLAQFDANGQLLEAPLKNISLNLKQDTHQTFLANGLTLKDSIAPVPAAKSLRVIVRDFSTGMIGSITVQLKDI